MKSFTPSQLSRSIPLGLSWMIGTVMEGKGRQELFEHQSPEKLRTLRQQAIVQSTESSNRIEGVTVERERLLPLVLGKTKPRDRSEEEIVGYRQALSHIHENHAHCAIDANEIKHLHALAQGGHSADAGEYKRRDNDIIQLFPDGRREVRFSTVEASQTLEAMKQLQMAYEHTLQQGLLPPLLLIANTVFDFLCIHPFRDGNGRVSRLLTLLLLYQHGYRVGRYISLERIIEETKESYYEALHASSAGESMILFLGGAIGFLRCVKPTKSLKGESSSSLQSEAIRRRSSNKLSSPCLRLFVSLSCIKNAQKSVAICSRTY